jgi:hypothetical protein
VIFLSRSESKHALVLSADFPACFVCPRAKVRSGLHRSVLVSVCGSVLGFFARCPMVDLSFVPTDLKHFVFYSRFAVEGIISLI